MARTFVNDTDQYYRTDVLSANGEHYKFYGPYGTVGMAKSMGSRELNYQSFHKDHADWSFKIQKLEAVIEWQDRVGYENDYTCVPVAILKWVDVNG